MKTLYILEITYIIGLYLFAFMWWRNNGWKSGGFFSSRSDNFKHLFMGLVPIAWSLLTLCTDLIAILNGVHINGVMNIFFLVGIPLMLVIIFLGADRVNHFSERMRDKKAKDKYNLVTEWVNQFDFLKSSKVSVYISNNKAVGRANITVDEEDVHVIESKRETLPSDIYLDIRKITERERELKGQVQNWVNQFPNYNIENSASYYKPEDKMHGSLIIVAPPEEFGLFKEKSSELPKGIQMVLASTQELAKEYYKWSEIEKEPTQTQFLRFKVE